MDQAGPFLLLLTEGSLLHSKQIADVIEIVRLAVFLSDFLFYKLIPVIYRESLGRYHHFVPMSLNVVFLGRFGYVQSIKFYSSSNFFLSFENSQWYLSKQIYSYCISTFNTRFIKENSY